MEHLTFLQLLAVASLPVIGIVMGYGLGFRRGVRHEQRFGCTTCDGGDV